MKNIMESVSIGFDQDDWLWEGMYPRIESSNLGSLEVFINKVKEEVASLFDGTG
jgi:hypothetical protein